MTSQFIISTARRLARLSREFFWIGLGQAVAALGAIVGVRLMTQVLPPSTYGELSLGMTIAMLAQQTVLSPISGAALRFFAPAHEATQLRGYIFAVRQLLALGTIILLVLVGVAGLVLFMLGRSDWLGLVLTTFLFALFSGFSAALDGMQNAARQRVIVAWHDAIAPWLRFFSAAALVTIIGVFSQVAMMGYAVASLIVLGSQFLFFRRRIFSLTLEEPMDTTQSAQSWKNQMSTYAWPFATWGIFTWAQLSSDRWALQTFTTTSNVGLYAALYQIGYYPMMLLSGLLSQLVTPILFHRAGDGADFARLHVARRLNAWLVGATILLTLFAVLVAALSHSFIFSILVAPDYRSVSPLLPWMVFSSGLFMCGQMVSLLLMTGIQTQNLVFPKIATALLGVTLNFIGAFLFGVEGVIWGNIGFASVYLVWMLVLAYTTIRNISAATVTVSSD